MLAAACYSIGCDSRDQVVECWLPPVIALGVIAGIKWWSVGCQPVSICHTDNGYIPVTDAFHRRDSDIPL